jgi:hypothetical protein
VQVSYILDSGPLGRELVDRINSLSEPLAIATMDLFRALLDLNDPIVINKLVLYQLHNEHRTIQGGGASEAIPNSAEATALLEGVGNDAVVSFASGFPGSPVERAKSVLAKPDPTLSAYLNDAERTVMLMLSCNSFIDPEDDPDLDEPAMGSISAPATPMTPGAPLGIATPGSIVASPAHKMPIASLQPRTPVTMTPKGGDGAAHGFSPSPGMSVSTPHQQMNSGDSNFCEGLLLGALLDR